MVRVLPSDRTVTPVPDASSTCESAWKPIVLLPVG